MRRLFKYLTPFAFCLGLLSLLAFGGCSTPPDSWKGAKPGQKRVLVSFAPLYSLTTAIAGDDAYVNCFLTGDNGPHGYGFTPQDRPKLRGADLLISNGLQLDNDFINKLNATRPPVPELRVGEVIPKELLHVVDEDAVKAEGGHVHGIYDPHIWLGPAHAVAVAEKIAAKLGEIDPEHKSGYERRAAELITKIRAMHEDGKAKLAGKKNRNLVTMHESMHYFADAFDLTVVGAIQKQPGQDPDAAAFAQLERLCRDKQVAAIAVEPQYSQGQAEQLRKQLTRRGLDVKLVEFDPLETAPAAPGSTNPNPDYYLNGMRRNLDNLAKALP